MSIFLHFKTKAMFVIAHHFIHDPETFWNLAPQVIASLPSHLKVHCVYPSTDLKTGTCVWEAPAVADVQDLLDKSAGQYSRNVCYEVNQDIALGLPQTTTAEAFA